jgi:hypothetical protein
MTWQRCVLALLWAMIALLVSFLLINVIMIAWYAHTEPHDGQSGLAAMMWAFIVAPVCGLVTLAIVLRRGG